jgi:hypothetical protein
MAGALIAYRNLSDAVALTVTGGVLADFPIENVQIRALSKVCRLGAGGPPTINVDLGVVRDVRIVALLAIGGVLLTGNDDVLLSYSRDNATWNNATLNIVSDAGVPELPTGVFLVPTRPPTDFTPPGGPAGSPGIRARYLRIRPNWTPSGGYREIARLWVSDALVIPEGVEASWSLGYQDTGNLDVSGGLQYYEEPKARSRTLDCSLPKLETLQAFGFDEGATSAADVPCIQGLQMKAGKTSELIVLPRTSNPLWIRRLGIYGHLSEAVSIDHRSGPYYSARFRMIEER